MRTKEEIRDFKIAIEAMANALEVIKMNIAYSEIVVLDMMRISTTSIPKENKKMTACAWIKLPARKN